MSDTLHPGSPEHTLFQQMLRIEQGFQARAAEVATLAQIQATLEHVQTTLAAIQGAQSTLFQDLNHLKDELRRRDGVVHRLDDHGLHLQTLKEKIVELERRQGETEVRQAAIIQRIEGFEVQVLDLRARTMETEKRLEASEKSGRDREQSMALAATRMDVMQATVTKFAETDTLSLSKGARWALGILATAAALAIAGWIVSQASSCNPAQPPGAATAAP